MVGVCMALSTALLVIAAGPRCFGRHLHVLVIRLGGSLAVALGNTSTVAAQPRQSETALEPVTGMLFAFIRYRMGGEVEPCLGASDPTRSQLARVARGKVYFHNTPIWNDRCGLESESCAAGHVKSGAVKAHCRRAGMSVTLLQ